MKKSLKTSGKNIAWLFITNLVIWQNALLRVSSLFRYVDELLMLFFIGVILLNTKKLKSSYVNLFLWFGGLILLGLVGNFASDVERSITVILMDILYFSKLYICFIGALIYFTKTGTFGRVSKLLADEIRVITWIGVVLAAVSQFSDIGMTHGVRFGFNAFQFVFSSPGMFSQYCIIFLVILTIDLDNAGSRFVKHFHIALLFVLWGSTGRTRALAVIFVWALLMAVSKSRRLKSGRQSSIGKRLKVFLKPQYVIFAVVAVSFMGRYQVEYYLGGETETARGLLLRGGIAVMRDYFPFGAGLSTFGTEMAASNYSPLYYRYGLSSHWALAEGGGELTDCFWPAVGAEFGIFGLLIMAVIVWKFCSMLIKSVKGTTFCTIAVLTYIAYLLISSTATSIFTAYTTTGFIVVILGLIADTRNGVKQDENSDSI